MSALLVICFMVFALGASCQLVSASTAFADDHAGAAEPDMRVPSAAAGPSAQLADDPGLAAGSQVQRSDVSPQKGAKQGQGGAERGRKAPKLTFSVHRQGGAWVAGEEPHGTAALDAFRVALDPGACRGGIAYRCHVAGGGWQGWVRNDACAGMISGRARLDAVRIMLTGAVAKRYVVAYRVNVEGAGWLPWVTGGVASGRSGARVKALQVRLMAKPQAPRLSDAGQKRPLADGLYTLSTGADGGVSASVRGASLSNGANVQLASRSSGALEQKWLFTWRGDGYEVMNANSGLVLDAGGARGNLISNVKQTLRTGSATQRWLVTKVGKGSFTVVSMATGAHLAPFDYTLDSTRPTGTPPSKVKDGTNLALTIGVAPSVAGKAQAFSIRAANAIEPGTYRLFSKANRTRLCAAAPGSSLASGSQALLSKAHDSLAERFVVIRDGDSLVIQVASTGTYLTAVGGRVVQWKKCGARCQRWFARVSQTGGVQFVNRASGKVMAAQASPHGGYGLAEGVPSASSAQRWFAQPCELLPAGLYELSPRCSHAQRLDVAGGSYATNANAQVYTRNDRNWQKFAIASGRGGWCRIGMALGNTVLTVAGSSASSGANVRMQYWRGSPAQLWKPVVTDLGLAFVNRKSGKALSVASASVGANVRQATLSKYRAQSVWALAETKLNARDEDSMREIIGYASDDDAAVGNGIVGHAVSRSRWSDLVDALDACYSNGISVGFAMMDLSTGFMLGADADDWRFGASTIKGLYVTYLFEEYLEEGNLSWDDIADLAEDAIVWSDNDAYQALRARFGSAGGFDDWLADTGMSYGDAGGIWGSYSARMLARGWIHAASYLSSAGRYVDTWKRLFSHSDHSFIDEALDGRRATYTKPGWMEPGTWSGSIMNDAGVVEGQDGRLYLLSFSTDANPDTERGLLRDVVRALDAIHAELPASRS